MQKFLVLCAVALTFALASHSVAQEPAPAPQPLTFETRLLQDWTMQDEPNEAIRAVLFQSADSSEKERAIVERVFAELAEREVDTVVLRERFDALVAENVVGSDARWLDLYKAACSARRVARLEVAIEAAPKIVYAKHYVLGANHYTYSEDVTDEANHNFNANQREGGAICIATIKEDGTVENETIVNEPRGAARDPDVSWDGKKILFSKRSSFVDDDYHLYEYDVETKTTRQLTFGAGSADIEPIYLPNDDLLFSSTRCTQIVDCDWAEVSNFFTCDKNGDFMRRLSVDQVTVNYPKLLDDGRVIYTRWDYNDRGQIFPQPLFQMNPDGAAQTEFYGNNSYFPTTIGHARGIPGTDKVIAIAAGHHTYQNGKLLLIERSKGSQENSGATLIAPVRETPADRVDAYGEAGELFQYPYAIDEENFYVAFLPEGTQGRSYAIPFGLYWFDPDGKRELLAFDPNVSCGQPIPLAERQRPTMRPSQVDLTKTTGQYYVQDVYEGPGLAGIPRGTIKELRVVALEFRSSGIRANTNGGPAGGAMISSPIAIGGGTWDVKHVLGTVPVEEDGSAYFEVPAMLPVYFQMLDANGDVVQTMRSWSTLQPGETFACVGCHETKDSVIENATATGATSIALRKGVAQLTPELHPGKGCLQEAGFSFTRDVQPILDTYCVDCHSGGLKPDGTPAPFSLRENLDVSEQGAQECAQSGRFFSEAYLNLTAHGNNQGPYVRWIGIQEGPQLLPPYFSGAAKSPLITMFRDKDGNVGGQDEAHKDVKIDAKSLRTLAMWIDLLIPYCGDYAEAANWLPEEWARYHYYLSKRAGMEHSCAVNTQAKIAREKLGDDANSVSYKATGFGGCQDRDLFINGFFFRRAPSVAKRSGKFNEYRNLALNPKDVQGEGALVALYPHATSNTEYGRMDEFAAKNTIDGVKENRGHGPAFPSWGPTKRTDPWINVDFGCEVEIDKAVVYLRADFPHDGVWATGTFEFSDGATLDVTFKETNEPQVFEFPKRRVTSVKLTNLVPSEYPTKWIGITELEYWGVSVE